MPEPLFQTKDVVLRIVDALQKSLKAIKPEPTGPEELVLQQKALTDGAKINLEVANGGGEGPINVKVIVRGLELLILGTTLP